MVKYRTSQDYNKLYELVKDGYKVVCFIKSDVIWARYIKTIDEVFIGTQSMEDCFLAKTEKDNFLEYCEWVKLEYIKPLVNTGHIFRVDTSSKDLEGDKESFIDRNIGWVFFFLISFTLILSLVALLLKK